MNNSLSSAAASFLAYFGSQEKLDEFRNIKVR